MLCIDPDKNFLASKSKKQKKKRIALLILLKATSFKKKIKIVTKLDLNFEVKAKLNIYVAHHVKQRVLKISFLLLSITIFANNDKVYEIVMNTLSKKNQKIFWIFI